MLYKAEKAMVVQPLAS